VKIYLANDLAADARVRVVLPSSGGQRGIFTTEVDDEPVAWRPAAAAPLEGLDLLATLANGPSANLSRRYRLWFANRHPLL
jgi:hypothetical protein